MTKRFLTFGESMGLVIGDELNHLSQVHSARISTGGSEGNVAIGMSRLGISSTWFSRLGQDGFGQRIAKDLRGEGVVVKAIFDSHAPTGLMVKTSPRAGVTSVDYFRKSSAASRLRPQDLDQISFEDYDLVHITGITPALSESCLDFTFESVQRAKGAGCLVSFDVNYRSKLWSAEKAAPVFRALAGACDVLIAGVEEAQLISSDKNNDPVNLANQIAKLGVGVVAIKLGEAGAIALADNHLFSASGIKVQVIDTVGAGDAFTAALLATYLIDNDLELALQRAVISGGLACAHPGDWQGLPFSHELENFDPQEPVNR